METKRCPCCNLFFETNKSNKVYCSRLCTKKQSKRRYDKKLMKNKIERGYIPRKKVALSVGNIKINGWDIFNDKPKRKMRLRKKLKEKQTTLSEQEIPLENFNESLFAQKYVLQRKEDLRGHLKYYLIFIGTTEFLFDEKGLTFFKKNFDNDFIFEEGGYLVRSNNDKLEYFHREFKKSLINFGIGFVVHHKNFKKNDNRNCNLQIMSEQEHKALHDRIIQEKIRKAQEKYERRGERMREKYLERGLKMRERYLRRGEGFRRKGERVRRSSAFQTYKRKFLSNNPNSNYKSVSYHWTKFKKKHSI